MDEELPVEARQVRSTSLTHANPAHIHASCAQTLTSPHPPTIAAQAGASTPSLEAVRKIDFEPARHLWAHRRLLKNMRSAVCLFCLVLASVWSCRRRCAVQLSQAVVCLHVVFVRYGL